MKILCLEEAPATRMHTDILSPAVKAISIYRIVIMDGEITAEP